MKIAGLDGLRAIAISLVIINHLGLILPYLASPGVPAAYSIVSGTAGVKLFFCLSGFLITFLLLAEIEREGRVDIPAFFVRRILRIFPAYYCFLLVVWALAVQGVLWIPRESLLASAIYTYNFLPQSLHTSELAHTWSLAVEEHFYLVWPLVLACTGRRPLIFVAAVAVMLAATLAVHDALTSRPDVLSQYMTTYWTSINIVHMLIGGLMALAVRSASLRRWMAGPEQLGMLLVAYLSFVWTAPMLGYFGSEIYFATCCAGLIGWLYCNPTSAATRMLEHPVLRYVGTRSYSLYVWHGLFVRNGPGGTAWFQQPVVNLVLTLVVAELSYRLVEQTFLGLKRRYGRRRDAAAATPVSTVAS